MNIDYCQLILVFKDEPCLDVSWTESDENVS